MTTRGLAYEPFVDSSDGTPRFTARFTCHGCGATADVVMNGHKHNPEWVAKKVREQGWEADVWRRRLCRCPACAKSAPRSRPPVPAIDDPEEETTEAMPEITTTSKPGVPNAALATVREATQEERYRIRQMLDAHFDDAKGCYLDGYSDQKIGAELNLPWAMVTRIREAAYGPILVDPAVEQYLAAVAELEERIKRVETASTTAVAGLRAELEKLRAQGVALEKRVAGRGA